MFNLGTLLVTIILLTELSSVVGQKKDSEVSKELYVQTGHTSFIHSVAISPDMRLLASGSEDSTIKLWNFASGLEVKLLKGHNSGVTSLGFLSDSNRLISGSWDGTIKLWSVTTGREINTLIGHIGAVNAVAVSMGNKFIASGGDDGTVRLWDLRSGRTVNVFGKDNGAINTIAFSPKGTLIAAGGDDDVIRIWDVASGKEMKRLPTPGSNVQSIVFSPDSNTLASSGLDKTIRIWNLKSESIQRLLREHTNAIETLAFSKDGKLLASGSWDETIKLWDVDSWRTLKTLKGHTSVIGSVQFSPDGKSLASAGFDRTIKLWSVANGTELKSLERHSYYPLSIAISPNGNMMVLSDDTQAIKVWHLAPRTQLKVLVNHRTPRSFVRAAAFSSDSTKLALGDDDGVIELWDIRAGQQLRSWKGHEEAIISIAFSPKDNLLATGSTDKSIKVWDFSKEKEIGRYRHDSYVNLVVFSRDGKILTGGTVQEKIKRWDLDEGKLLSSFSSKDIDTRKEEMPELYRAYNKIFFDGSIQLRESENGRIDLYDVSTNKLIVSLVALDINDWVMVAEDGRFDTSKLDRPVGLHWIMSDAPVDPEPFEIFMRNYYEPKLLRRLLDGENFRTLPPLTNLNRAQPSVRVISVHPGPSQDLAKVTVEVSDGERRFQRNGRQVFMRTDVHDLHLFRDGQLVGQWPEPKSQSGKRRAVRNLAVAELKKWQDDTRILLNPSSRKARRTFTVRLPHAKAGEKVQFTAYAFNLERVKSATVSHDYQVPASLPARKGKAYVIAVGVNAYQHENWDLSFTANDARLIGKRVSEKLAATKQYEEVIPLTLISDYSATEPVAGQSATLRVKRKVRPRVLIDDLATKQNFKAILDLLAGRPVAENVKSKIAGSQKLQRVTPDDLVLIAFSSHGYTDKQGIFYFIPYDTGPVPQGKITPEVLKNFISSAELSEWVRDIDAGEMVMVVDTCHSAATVESEGFKPGPMGSRGLGQLAYDKGMRILAASQADDVALENEKLQQGLLTYALMHDGIEAEQADYQPKDNELTIEEWLNYAVERVPSLYEEVKVGQVQTFDKGSKDTGVNESVSAGTSSLKKNAFKQPSLFDFKRNIHKLVLAYF